VKLNGWRITGAVLVLAFVLCFGFISPAAAAAGDDEEQEGPQLTLQEAVERALMMDHGVREAKLERDKAREEKHKATDKLRDSYVYMTPEYEQDHLDVVMAELNYQRQSGREEAARDDLEAQVVEKYVEVLTAGEKVDLARQELAAAEWDYNAAEARRRNGMLSSIGLQQAASAVEQKRSELTRAEQELHKAYVDLNALMGQSAVARPQLVTELPFQPLEIRSMDAEVSRAVDSSHDLYALGRYVQIQRLQLRFYFLDRDIQEYEVELAELQEAKAKSEVQKQVRLFYQDILNLEEMVASAEESVKLAEQAFHVAQVRYEVGMAARGDLVRAEADLAAARQGLAELQYAHVSAAAAYRNLTGRTIIPAEENV